MRPEGKATLPFPKDPEVLWNIVSRIMDLRDNGVLVLAHHNADLDAVATSIIFQRLFPWVSLGAFKSISQPGKKLLDHMGIEMEVDRYGIMVLGSR